jgi:hypothetical protein
MERCYHYRYEEVSCNNNFGGHVKKGKIRDYWNTSKLIENPIFGKVMTRNRFEEIWNFWHYSDNSILDDEAERLYNIIY